ncbi:MAG: Gldg family protein [Planctomycetota bacterium]
MSNKTRSILGTIFVLIITFCAIFIVSKKTRGLGWYDATEEKLYTLTDGTKSILDKLDQKLKVRLFYAQEAANRSGHDFLLDFNNYYYYVRDLLRAYERRAKGKLELEELDPKPFSDAEELADQLQLQRYSIDERTGFYFGLAVMSDSGAKQVLKFLPPQEQSLLEYKVSEAIDLAGRTKKNKLGVLSSLSITGGGMSDYMRQMMAMQGRQSEQPWVISEHLRKQYEITDVPADTDTIPADVDFLLVVHPKDLPEKTLYAIDQFVVKGGKAMVFVDPFCMADQPARDPQNPFGAPQGKQSSSLEKLLNAWGVTVEADKFAGDLAYGRRGQWSRMSPDTMTFVGVMDFKGDAFNKDEVVSQGLKQVGMLFPGVVRKKDGAGTEVTPLITTTQEGNVWTAQSYELSGPMGPDVERLASKFQKGVEKLATAVRIAGKFKSAFDKKPGDEEKAENGDKKDGEDGKTAEKKEGDEKNESPTDEKKPDEPKSDHVAESTAANTVFVVADVDMLSDGVAYTRNLFGMFTPANSNADFVMNCIEQLSGSTDLISIRSRGAFTRPMEVVAQIEHEADMRTRDQVKRINDDIEKFESELADLNNKATDKNVGLLQAEAIDKQRKLEAEIRAKKREIRDLQQDKLTAVKSLGSWCKNITRVLIPLGVLVVGVLLAVRRHSVRKVNVLGGVS